MSTKFPPVPSFCLSYAYELKHGIAQVEGIDIDHPSKHMSVVDIKRLVPPTNVPIGGWYRDRIMDKFENQALQVRGIYAETFSQQKDGDRKFLLAGNVQRDVKIRCEIPSPECTVSSPWADKMAQAYEYVTTLKDGDLIDVIGVGFWDMYHYVPGGSFDPHEIHPVVTIRKVPPHGEL